MADQQASSAIEAQMREDLRAAQRERDQVRMDTLRLALGAFHNEEIARTDSTHKNHGQPLSEADRHAILDKQIKQRDEAARIYRDNHRADLAEKEEREVSILRAYMPAELTDEEIRAIVQRLITEQGKDFKRVMPLAAKETRGRADGRRVNAIVREMTS